MLRWRTSVARGLHQLLHNLGAGLGHRGPAGIVGVGRMRAGGQAAGREEQRERQGQAPLPGQILVQVLEAQQQIRLVLRRQEPQPNLPLLVIIHLVLQVTQHTADALGVCMQAWRDAMRSITVLLLASRI